MKIIASFFAGLLIAGLFAFTYSPHQETDKGLGRVEKKSGKYIFLECEPISEYDIAFEVKTTLFSEPKSIDGWVTPVLDKALKVSRKDKKEFDAIIIKQGQRIDLAIKFK